MNNIVDFYRKNVLDSQQRIARLRKTINQNALLRLLTIVLGATALFMAVQSEQVWLVMALFFTIIVLFMGLVWRQSKLEARRAALSDFLAVNQNELNIINGGLNIYPDGASFKDGQHPYSEDLDIFGTASLFTLVNRGATVHANRLLADWFLAPADAGTIIKRQQVVRELAPQADWCQQLQAKLLFNLNRHEDFKKQFSRFLSNGDTSFGNKYLRLYTKVVPWLMGFLAGLAFFFPVWSGIVILFAMVHLLAAVGYSARVNRIAGQVGKAGRLLGAFASSFALIESRHWQSHRAKELFATLCAKKGDKPVSVVFQELSVLIDRLDYRLNMLVGAVLNMFLLWDFRQTFAILDWRVKYGDDTLRAFDVVAEFEALVSLATVCRNNPNWEFPLIVEAGKPYVETISLSHPLIPSSIAVANDYRMDNHRLALITGSNMAGKSTFLRTLGSNAVLAFCGAPVCAKHMKLTVFKLATYMRIKDSLNESTSTFKAELNRINMILQTVKQQPDTFFLIDEMLRGTNSMDKYLGSKAIIKQLIADGGVGMVATHDLQLAKLAETYPSTLANYHFDIDVRQGEMVFDYKLKLGECTVFNASMLLKEIGVTIDIDD